jgi:hypothetical protein
VASNIPPVTLPKIPLVLSPILANKQAEKTCPAVRSGQGEQALVANRRYHQWGI